MAAELNHKAVFRQTIRGKHGRSIAMMHLSRHPSPLGDLLVVHADGAITALDFHDYEARLRRLLARNHGVTDLAPGPLPKPIADALDSYFSGNLAAFVGLALNSGGSDFQRKVWAALCAIPAGQTRSYGDLAASIGQPGAARAVGLANGANPIGIIVPCHRVIGSNGTLTGYAGGVERKAWLLRHEGAITGALL